MNNRVNDNESSAGSIVLLHRRLGFRNLDCRRVFGVVHSNKREILYMLSDMQEKVDLLVTEMRFERASCSILNRKDVF